MLSVRLFVIYSIDPRTPCSGVVQYYFVMVSSYQEPWRVLIQPTLHEPRSPGENKLGQSEHHDRWC